MKPQLKTVHCLLVTVLLAAASLHAQVPKLINYQGKLVRDGKLANGPVTLVFAIYADQDGGNPLWSQEKQLRVQNGIFNVLLGDETPAFDTLFTGKGQRWLEVNEKDKPRYGDRIQITSVAYALKANSANALDAPNGSRTDAVFVDNNGNVGIGTTNPSQALEVVGAIKSRDAYSTPGTAALVYTNDTGYLYLGPESGRSTNGANMTLAGPSNTVTGVNGGFAFNVPSLNSGVTAMSITQTGNVGIGTADPSLSVGRGLEINGNPGAVLRLTENSSALNHFEIRSVASGSGNMLQFGEGNQTFLSIRSDDDGGGTSQRGNVGIGTTNPQAKLDVFGSIAFFGNASIYRDGALNGLVFNTPGISGNPKMFISDQGLVGIGTTTPQASLEVTGCVVAQNVSCPSSRRWKTDIQPIEDALEKVRQLRGVSYVWKEDGKQNIGLIAEEVAEVIPEVVAFEENGKDARAIDYSRLVAVLIEAVKEQQKEIAALREEMKALQQQSR
jgi:hypothetical protein